MLTVTNSKGEKYKFNKEEMELMLMWAYGYMDLSKVLPIDLDTKGNTVIANFKEKLEQCLKDEYEIIKQVRGG